MAHIQTHTDDPELAHFHSISNFLEFEEIEAFYYSEPDYRLIDKYIDGLKMGVAFLGTIKVLSDENRKVVKKLAAKAFEAVALLEQGLNYYKSLPEHVSWKQKAHDKLEDLVILLEDIGEICALSASEEFTQMIEAEMKSLMDESAGD